MSEPIYRLDASLAALDNDQIEELWRTAVANNERKNMLILARQLVLRAQPVIEHTCLMCGRRVGLDSQTCDRAIEETSIRLMLRLLHDTRWPNLGAIAAFLAKTTVQQTRVRADPTVVLQPRPLLQVVRLQPREIDRSSEEGLRPKEEDHES